jgi:hypothetical protein
MMLPDSIRHASPEQSVARVTDPFCQRKPTFTFQIQVSVSVDSMGFLLVVTRRREA